MSVLIRCDASPEIGTGHVMRCLALADRLAAAGALPVFVARRMFPNLAERIAAAGFRLAMLPEVPSDNGDRAGVIPHADWLAASWRDDVDATLAVAAETAARWVVVDHYGVDRMWQAAARAGGLRVAALDDLADRAHDADLLIDPSLADDPHGRYAGLLPEGRQRLLGPRYTILRQEFAEPPERGAERADAPLAYLLAFGGVDAAGMSLRALAALEAEARPSDMVDVVVGGQNADRAEIERRAAGQGWSVHVDSDAMGALMAKADIAIGAGGHMLWERAAMRLPTVAVIVAENQRDQVNGAAARGLVLGLDAATASTADIRAAIASLARDDAARSRMVAACAAVDGAGADRIARRIAGPEIVMRPAADADCERLHAWRNHPRIRAVSREAGEIDLEGHRRWFAGVLADQERTLLIGEDAAGPVGVVRFDRDGSEAEVSIYLTPERLGGGFGANLLLAGEAWFRQNNSDIRRIVAEVLPGNAASEELFLSCGYDRRADGLFQKGLEG